MSQSQNNFQQWSDNVTNCDWWVQKLERKYIANLHPIVSFIKRFVCTGGGWSWEQLKGVDKRDDSNWERLCQRTKRTLSAINYVSAGTDEDASTELRRKERSHSSLESQQGTLRDSRQQQLEMPQKCNYETVISMPGGNRGPLSISFELRTTESCELHLDKKKVWNEQKQTCWTTGGGTITLVTKLWSSAL